MEIGKLRYQVRRLSSVEPVPGRFSGGKGLGREGSVITELVERLGKRKECLHGDL